MFVTNEILKHRWRLLPKETPESACSNGWCEHHVIEDAKTPKISLTCDQRMLLSGASIVIALIQET